jgi:PAS domain S-box-containing protein
MGYFLLHRLLFLYGYRLASNVVNFFLEQPVDITTLDYYEGLFKHLRQNTVIMIDADGYILDINTAFTTAFGYQPEDIIGKNFSILFTEENRLKDLPRRELNTVLAQGQATDNNYLVTRSNQLVWVTGESVLLHDSNRHQFILKIIYDIQVQKEAEASIIRLNELNENILSSIEDIVIVVNEEFKIEKANNAFYLLFTEAMDAGNDIPLTRIIGLPLENQALLDQLAETMTTKKGFSNKILSLHRDRGTEKIFDVSCTMLNVSEHGTHLLLTLHDITAHIQIEREREDIIGFVAHELRNPLANIMLCNEMIGRLAEEDNKAGIADFILRSKKNTMRLNRMVTELYDATKMNSGNFRLELSSFNLADMLKEAIQTVQILHTAYTIVINNDVPSVEIPGDRYRLIQAIDNFLTNSIKYSNGNTYIYISVTSDDNMVTFCVKDQGLGIPSSQLPYIFDRFFRAEKTKNLEGVGLGLYLCREIILAHNGRIWAESEEGKGSLFCFSIPLQPINL